MVAYQLLPQCEELVERILNWQPLETREARFFCEGAPLSWLYGPLITRRLQRTVDQSRRLSGSNYERGIDIVRRFHCKQVYVYAMGQEPWLNYVMSKKYADDSGPIVESNRLLADCQEQGITAERLFGEKEILLH